MRNRAVSNFSPDESTPTSPQTQVDRSTGTSKSLREGNAVDCDRSYRFDDVDVTRDGVVPEYLLAKITSELASDGFASVSLKNSEIWIDPRLK